MTVKELRCGRVAVHNDVVCIGGEHSIADGVEGDCSFFALRRQSTGGTVQNVEGVSNFNRRIRINERIDIYCP